MNLEQVMGRVPDNVLLGVVLEVCVVDQAVVVPPAPINQSEKNCHTNALLLISSNCVVTLPQTGSCAIIGCQFGGAANCSEAGSYLRLIEYCITQL